MTSHLKGVAAEDAVLRHYEGRGFACVAKRWKGEAGEIDLVLRHPLGSLVFVEVKTSSTLAQALYSLRPAQVARLMQSASAFLALQPEGQSTAARYDVAAFDHAGQIEVVENALAA
ncbi:MAG: YraN family protein [Pseudomonadota bacterium]